MPICGRAPSLAELMTDLYQLKRTPFHERTSRLCLPQNWRRWAGHIAVGSYDLGLEREYWAIRNHAALIDISPLIKYRISGRDAARLLHRLTPRDIHKMQVGQVYYTGWCDDDGKLLDDGTVTRIGEQEFRLTAAEPQYRWLAMNAVGMQVQVTELTEQMAALSLQGPKSRTILNHACEQPIGSNVCGKLTLLNPGIVGIGEHRPGVRRGIRRVVCRNSD